MLNIALYCDIQEKNEIRTALTEYLNGKNIDFKIYRVESAAGFLSKYFSLKEFQLLLMCSDNSLLYIMKTCYNYEKKYMHTVSGVLELPLTQDAISELLDSTEHTHRCPYGVYNASSRAVFRRIPHEDIEYIKREEGKSVIHLTNGETEEIRSSVKRIEDELHAKYFVKCCKGYIVNIFNIKKVQKSDRYIEMKSGAIIPLSQKNFQHFLKTYIFSMSGIKIWDD